MAIGQSQGLLKQFNLLFRHGTTAGLTDRDLLERFTQDRDQEAFAALVERHGPMVMRTCHAILHDDHDAQDAFQAVFLLLARRASRLWVNTSIAPWLHAVAWRSALDAKRSKARRRKHERSASRLAPVSVSSDPACDAGLTAALHEEIGWLPARHRAVIVLCDLEGRTHLEAARLLGCRVGTVKSRQARARARLRRQLIRRGLAPSADLIGGTIVAEAKAALPHAFSINLARVAAELAAGGPASTTACSHLLAKTRGPGAFLSGLPIRPSVITSLAVAGLAAGIAIFLGRSPAPAPRPNPQQTTVPAIPPLHTDAADPLPAGAVARLGRRRLSHGEAVTAVAFHPNGKLIASAGTGRVNLWDAATGNLVRELPGYAPYWQTLAFSPDGSILASGGDDWTIRTWDVATGKPIQTILAYRYGGGGPILPFPIAFTPDGKTLASGCVNGLIIFWDVATARESFRLEPLPARGNERAQNDRFAATISALAISPDGKTIASASRATGIQLWDLNKRRPLQAIPNDSVWLQLAFSPDGKTLAWAGRSPQPGGQTGIQLWDLRSNRLRRALPSDRRAYIAFSRDGRRLAATGADRAVKIWDIETAKLLQTMTGHTAQTNSVAFSPDGSTIASCSNDGSIRLWDWASGQERFGGPMDHWDQALSVSVAPDGISISIASRDRMIRTVDLATGELRRSLRVDGDILSAAALSPDGTKAATAESEQVRLYDLSSGRRSWSSSEFQLRPELAGINGNTTPGLIFSADGRRVVSLTLDLRNGVRQRATVRVWDTATGRLVSQIVRDRYVDAPPVLLDSSRTLVIAETEQPDSGHDPSLARAYLGFYETETGRPLRKAGTPERYTIALAAAPDGTWLATAGGNWVQVWDAASGTLAYSLGGARFPEGVARLVVSPDGTQIAALERGHGRAHGGLVHVWRLADGRRLHELPAGATALAFTPDSRSLITCASDGTALVWDLRSPATAPPARRQLTEREIESRWNALACGWIPHLADGGGRGARVDALAEGGDRTVEFLAPRLLDPKLAEKDEAQIAALWRPLSDPDPKIRLQAGARLEQHGVPAEAYLPETATVPTPAAFLENERQSLRECFRARRDEWVYHALRQIGTLRARWLLHRLADTLPDDAANRDRKQKAAETAASLDGARLKMPSQAIEKTEGATNPYKPETPASEYP